MATLHFISGKAGSGKTTLARELGRTLPAVVFCEDEWISTLGFEVKTVDDYVAVSGRIRNLVAPMATQLLRLGVNVVFDFAGNTVRGRAWVRSVFEAAGAEHVLHVLEASDDDCLARIRQRNQERPEGVWFGDVSEDLFRAVTVHFVAPTEAEGFKVKRRSAPR